MKTPLKKLIQIDPDLSTPVYKQIVQSIYRNIENGALGKDDVLPSVNSIAESFSLARGSVFTAYNELRSAGMIDSIPGKGYYVLSTSTRQIKNIFLLFSSFGPYCEALYNGLRNNLPKNYSVDIYFHHHNFANFESLIREKAGYYNTFIIMPEVTKETMELLSRLDSKHVFLLDTGFKEYRKSFSGVYQNFENDIYKLLKNAEERVAKYKRLILISSETQNCRDIIQGFNKFSKNLKIETMVTSNFNGSSIKKNDAFIVVDDRDLVEIITIVKKNNWQLGKDTGIISYNETPLKSIIADGITTISSDFTQMGKSMANMVTNGNRDVIENPFIYIDRNSF